jgi:hypothetical protein
MPFGYADTRNIVLREAGKRPVDELALEENELLNRVAAFTRAG